LKECHCGGGGGGGGNARVRAAKTVTMLTGEQQQLMSQFDVKDIQFMISIQLPRSFMFIHPFFCCFSHDFFSQGSLVTPARFWLWPYRNQSSS
jgi:hypothetical protein